VRFTEAKPPFCQCYSAAAKPGRGYKRILKDTPHRSSCALASALGAWLDPEALAKAQCYENASTLGRAKACDFSGNRACLKAYPSSTSMAGLGKFLKQAQKAQKQVEQVQQQLAARELEVSAGGGAVRIKINGAGDFLALTLDPEFLKEDATVVAQTVLEAVKQAAAQAKAVNEEEMNKITSQFQMPGLF
jgi:DNA-binding YbaB/EbfC family protein